MTTGRCSEPAQLPGLGQAALCRLCYWTWVKSLVKAVAVTQGDSTRFRSCFMVNMAARVVSHTL